MNEENGTLKKKKKGAAVAFAQHTNQVVGTVLRGIKMAGPIVYDPSVNPLVLFSELKSLGVEALAWRPETLFYSIDKKYSTWSPERAAKALAKFHATGVIDTEVPDLVRQKIYSLRILVTSDSAHQEWHIFEKIGGAFNNRLGHFGVVEPLSSSECARTVALIDSIRPDVLSHEVRAYIAACCHQEGIYTLKPSKYLNVAEDLLAMMNREETGRPTDDKIVDRIAARFDSLKKEVANLVAPPADDFVTVQALRLLAIDTAGADAVRN